MDPTYASAHFNLGISFQEKGNYIAALSCYRRAHSMDVTFTDALNAAEIIEKVVTTACRGELEMKENVGCNEREKRKVEYGSNREFGKLIA